MPKLTVNWSRVPDSDFLETPNTKLAERLGCSPQNVRHQRALRGLEPRPVGSGTRPAAIKPPCRLSRAAAARLRSLASAAGLPPSSFILSLPSPAPDGPDPTPAQNHIPCPQKKH